MFQAYRKLALIELASQAAIEFKPRQVLVKLDTPSSFWPTKVGVGDNKDRPKKSKYTIVKNNVRTNSTCANSLFCLNFS